MIHLNLVFYHINDNEIFTLGLKEILIVELPLYNFIFGIFLSLAQAQII